uniref:EGF-like domain-containing protein n=1 Tax=Monopterus albus TaxID=43700 RepID=A0A3Q3IJX5_MONAL|nr:epigen-like [Monopterus albus]
MALLLLLTTAGQSTALTHSPQTTETPLLSNVLLTTQLNNSSMDSALVMHSHRPCRSEHENYCENGGECMYPQDNDKPFCICTSSYSGPRCLFFNGHTRSLPEIEQLIGISIGVVMLIFLLAIAIYCFAHQRCIKSAPLIKSAPSEMFV